MSGFFPIQMIFVQSFVMKNNIANIFNDKTFNIDLTIQGRKKPDYNLVKCPTKCVRWIE